MNFKKIITLITTLLLPIIFWGQEVQDTSQDIQKYYEDAVQAYNDQQYIQAYDLLKKYESQGEWFSSLGYWKAITLDKIIKYNNVGEQKFVELNATVQRLLTEAVNQKDDSRDLYDEHYRAIILIEEKLNFVILKQKWKNDASFQKAIASFQKQDYSVAKLNAEEAAKSNNGAALLMIGQIYEIGNAAQPQNFKTAMQYYESAYLAGSYDAAYHIGFLYFHGYGVIKNINTAFQWCKIAATYNYIPAMMELSNMYKHGLGTPKDPLISQYWMEMAKTQPL